MTTTTVYTAEQIADAKALAGPDYIDGRLDRTPEQAAAKALVEAAAKSAKADRRITVALSDSRPVRIRVGDWPLIASATWFSGQHECQANEEAEIRVRQHDADTDPDRIVPHADGRVLVYGSRDRGPGGPMEYRGRSAGYMLAPIAPATEVTTEQIVRAIRRVAGAIDMPDLASECIADLPAEDC